MDQSTSGLLTFLRSMLDNPRQIGAVLPSSSALGQLMSRHVALTSDGGVLEIGAGTGVVTEALLDAGVPRERLFVVELDGRLHGYLQKRFAGVNVLHGDAMKVGELLPPHWVGRIDTVVSSMPLRFQSKAFREGIVGAAFAVTRPNGAFLQYTYPPNCPLPAAEMGLSARCVGRIWLNVPPAAVWEFRRKAAEQPLAS